MRRSSPGVVLFKVSGSGRHGSERQQPDGSRNTPVPHGILIYRDPGGLAQQIVGLPRHFDVVHHGAEDGLGRGIGFGRVESLEAPFDIVGRYLQRPNVERLRGLLDGLRVDLHGTSTVSQLPGLALGKGGAVYTDTLAFIVPWIFQGFFNKGNINLPAEKIIFQIN